MRVRCAGRKGPVFGVVFGNFRNLGDSALASALLKALPGCRLEPYLFRPKERWLARIGLSGRRLFDGVVVGGGTLINDMAIRPVRVAREQGLPVWIMGAGAGRGAYLLDENPDMTEWRPLLHECEAVGVRGPISRARLQAAGFDHATVLGDTALIFTPDQLPPAGDPRLVALNVISPNPSPGPRDWRYAHLAGLIHTVRRLRTEGYRFRPFAMAPEDCVATAELLAAAGVPETAVFLPTHHRELKSHLAGCGLAISMRLHGAVLAAAWGIPMVQIGYMEKAEDFAQGVGLERQLVPVTQALESTIRRTLEYVQGQGESGRRHAWANAAAARDRIEAFGGRILDRFSAGSTRPVKPSTQPSLA